MAHRCGFELPNSQCKKRNMANTIQCSWENTQEKSELIIIVALFINVLTQAPMSINYLLSTRLYIALGLNWGGTVSPPHSRLTAIEHRVLQTNIELQSVILIMKQSQGCRERERNREGQRKPLSESNISGTGKLFKQIVNSQSDTPQRRQ